MPIDVDALRAEFPVFENVAYFACNGLGPMPRRTRDACVEAYDAYLHNGLLAHFQFPGVVESARTRGAELLNAQPSEIAFCRNTGHGMLWAANAIPWEPGDEVVVPFRDYPSVAYPFLMLERQGRLKVALPEMDEPVPGARRLTLDVIASAVTERTRAVALSFVQFDCGYRADLEAIGAFCRERDIYLVVDAIQGLGALPLDVHRCGIDFLAAGGHKWMLATQGTGVFFARAELQDRLAPMNINFGGMLSSDGMDTDVEGENPYPADVRPGAARFEEGSRNLIGIIGQDASLGLLLELGIEAIAARVKDLTDYVCAGATDAGCTILSDRGARAWSGIVLFTPPPGRTAGEVQAACLADGILVNNHEGHVHMGVHAYNTHEEIDRVLAHVR